MSTFYTSMNEREQVIKRLLALLPGLEESRLNHLDWALFLKDVPHYSNPDLGDSEFHSNQVKVYDERISAIKQAIDLLRR